MTSLKPYMRIFILTFSIAFIAVAALAQAPATPATPAPPDVLPANEVAPPADAEKSKTGLVSIQVRPGNSAEKPAATDIVTVHYTGWSSDGLLFDSSIVRGPASTFPLDKVMAGWRECVQLMTLGEKRRCWVPENLAYRGQAGRPKGTVLFEIELLDTRPNPLVAPPDVKGPPDDAKRTPTGLAYKVLRPGKGIRNPSRFGRVTVHYTGWTTDGRMFDSSVTKGQPTTFRLDDVIKGWTEGVPLMVEGERTRFWVPENLAYGGKGDGPRGMLVFDIELLKIDN
jgi:FKBP-type peptidyl-prolyl cis-trans isomerase